MGHVTSARGAGTRNYLPISGSACVEENRMSRDEIDDLDPEQSPGVGTDGSLTSHHHQHHGDDEEEHVGVGTDGSLHSHHHHHHRAEDDDPEGTDGSLRDPDE
jgi:hypothetical protein